MLLEIGISIGSMVARAPAHRAPGTNEALAVTITPGSGIEGQTFSFTADGDMGLPAAELAAVQWLLGGAEIPDATDMIYQAAAAGTLSVEVTWQHPTLGDFSATSAGVTVSEGAPGAPDITSAGAISSASGLGKVGHAQTATGVTFTGDGVTISRAWERDGTPISGATGFSYIPVAADDGTDLTAVTTATNTSGSDSGDKAAQAITYVAPVATDSGVWSEAEDTGDQTFDAAALFFAFADPTFAGCSWSIPAAVAGETVDSDGLITAPTATAFSGTITVRCTNSGGHADATIAFAVVAPPVTPPTITAIADQSLAISDTPTTITATTSAGTPPITWDGITPAVFKPVIREIAADIYAFDQFYAANVGASVLLEQQWVVDGTDASGRTGQTFDNTTPAFGANATAALKVKFRVNGGSWVESDAVVITGANTNDAVVTDPVVLSTSAGASNGTNTAALTYDTTHGAYSAGDLIIVAQGNDRAANQVTPISITTTGGAAGGPDGETVVTDQALFDNTVAGTGGTCMALFHYLASTSKSSGANIRGNVTTNAEQFAMPVLVIDADTFDAADPIQVIGTSYSATAVANLSSAAGTVTRAGARIFVIGVTDAEPVTNGTPPSGWEYLATPHDFGAIGTFVARRIAPATAGEVLSAVNFPMSAGTWVATTFAVNGGEPLPPDYSVYYGPSGQVPVLVLDFDQEEYARITNGGSTLEEIEDVSAFIANYTSRTTVGATTGLTIGAGLTPRFLTSDFDFSATAGTIVIEYECDDVAAGDRIIDVNDGTTNNSIRIYADGGTTWRQFVRVGGVTQVNLTGVAVSEVAPQIAAFAWSADDFAGSIDGDTIDTDAAGTIPPGLTTVCLGANNGVGSQPEGVIKTLRVFNTRVTNTDLVTMSGA